MDAKKFLAIPERELARALNPSVGTCPYCAESMYSAQARTSSPLGEAHNFCYLGETEPTVLAWTPRLGVRKIGRPSPEGLPAAI